MQKIRKVSILAIVLLLCCCFGVSSFAATPKINKTSVSVTIGKTYTLKVSNATKAVTWKTSNNKVAIVSSKGVVTAVESGTATITATTGSKKLTCKVTVPAPKISKTSATVVTGKTLALSVSNYGKTVKWSSSNKSVATVSSKGVVTAVASGSATITATAGSKKLTCKVTVPTPKLSKTKATVTIGKTLTLSVSNYGKTVSWKSSNSNVATVSSKGVVKAVTSGTATITATCGKTKLTCKVTATGTTCPADVKEYGDHVYCYFSQECSWEDAEAACEKLGGHLVTVTSAKENEFVYSISGGHDIWLGATDKVSEGTWEWVTDETWDYTNWKSNQPDNDDGDENYLEMGYFNDSTWNDHDGNNSYICEWDCSKSVLNATHIDKTTASCYYGDKVSLKVINTAATVTWSSSNSSIATVSSKGVVTGKNLGTATITAKTGGKALKCTVTVYDRDVSSTASMECSTGGTFIKGMNNAIATFKLNEYGAGKVTVNIIDAADTVVITKTFSNVAKETSKSFTWDGKNSSGSYVSAGSYRLKITVGEEESFSEYIQFFATSDFAGGDGSENNPFLVSNLTQFKKISKNVDAYYKQTADIDFDYTSVEGLFGEKNKFNGTYDGNNKQILNLSSSQPIFEFLTENGNLKNMILKDCASSTSTGDYHTANLVKYNYGRISNCKFSGGASALTADDYCDAGAAMICVWNYGVIENCEASGKVSATVSDDWPEHAHTGGIAVYNQTGGRIVNCTVDVDVKSIDALNSGRNSAYAGGIVEYNIGDIVNCTTTGEVSSSDGFMGSVVCRNDGNIRYCEYDVDSGIDVYWQNNGVIM